MSSNFNISGFNYSPTNIKDRVIYVLIADGKLVKAYADISMANDDYQKLIQFSKPGAKISPPIACRFVDNQTIDSKGFNRVRTSEF